VISPGFWHGKTVLITGHTGFKGAWLSLWLQRLGARVVGYALSPPTSPSLFALAGVEEGMTSHLGDIRDLERLTQVLREERPDIVLHLAAQALVRRSYEDPLSTYAVNVMGTVNVLEAARHCDSLRAIVVVTSDKCYDNQDSLWGYRETDAMGGFDPYSSSKGCAELVAAAYRASYLASPRDGRSPIALATARAGNVIGGGDWAADRLIPDVIRAFLAQQPVILRNPQAVRPWQHVLEPLRGYLILAERLWQEGAAVAEGWNFGPVAGSEATVGQVVETLARRWGEGAHWDIDSSDHPHEAHQLRLDIAKARVKLGWQPVWDLERTLAETIAWYQAFARREDLRHLCGEQIAAYERESLYQSGAEKTAETQTNIMGRSS